MKNLFLASSFADVADEFKRTEATSFSGKKVTFIPTASIHEEVDFYVGEARSTLENFGLIVDVVDVSNSKAEDIKARLEENDYIYISGGNTFFLLAELIRSNTKDELVRQINRGKTYIGESAGAIILSPDISYIHDMDDSGVASGLDSYQALNVVEFYPLPHYGNYPFKDVTENIYKKYRNLINIKPFSNNQAFRIRGEVVEKCTSSQKKT